MMASRSKMSTKRKFVADGVFYAELNELLTREVSGGAPACFSS